MMKKFSLGNLSAGADFTEEFGRRKGGTRRRAIWEKQFG
jgi:hypothetical protein